MEVTNSQWPWMKSSKSLIHLFVVSCSSDMKLLSFQVSCSSFFLTSLRGCLPGTTKACLSNPAKMNVKIHGPLTPKLEEKSPYKSSFAHAQEQTWHH